MPRDTRVKGWIEVNPAFAGGFPRLRITTATAFLELPGEVVSGHPDRHVRRVELPGFSSAFYLKRQHVVTRRERFRNWLAGTGWVSRSEREARTLRELEVARLPGPRWVAVGEDGEGRAFLLVEEVLDSVDLRQLLNDSSFDAVGRDELAGRLGSLIARIHAAGFSAPDFTAKHILVDRETGAITPIDWPSARRTSPNSLSGLVRMLAALHASVADECATPRERLRVLRSLVRSGPVSMRVADLAWLVLSRADRLRGRRTLRDQRHTQTQTPRLVWIAGEAVCAIPDVAASWPTPAIAPPFYDCEPAQLMIRLADSRDAFLIRGRSWSPLARLAGALKSRPWRSSGATLGRVLFHLGRYGIPGPRLLAFGQRLTGPCSAEWFALHTPPPRTIANTSPAIARQAGWCLRKLHDAGCRPIGDPRAVFGLDDVVCIRDATAVRIVKRLSRRMRELDLDRLIDAFGHEAGAGYSCVAERHAPPPTRLVPTG